MSLAWLALGWMAAAQSDVSYLDREANWAVHQQMAEESIFRGLPWRCIGPTRQGGRVVDLEMVPGKPQCFYVAYASGGLWKTTNHGLTMRPLFDQAPTMIIGDIALDARRPDTIWVGTGENNSSRSSYGGGGVFRSDDGGEHWSFLGLAETDRIGRIMVDPKDSDRVFVAALGKLYTPGGLRGVFRTQDGGKSWEHVLPFADVTGAIDLEIDPQNPDFVYAATWQRLRRPHDFEESGPGSGLWRSADGGTTWEKLSGGFPQGKEVGRIGLSVAHSQPSTIYACLDNQAALPEEDKKAAATEGDADRLTVDKLRAMTTEEFLKLEAAKVESFLRDNNLDPAVSGEKALELVKKGELTLDDLVHAVGDANVAMFDVRIRGLEVWRSDDHGTTWRKTHDEPLDNVVFTYGYYFGQIRVSAQNPDRIYVLGVPVITSGDGGKTWSGIFADNVHVDHHALWIDPADDQHLAIGNDGGINVSYDGGQSFFKVESASVGQFYAVAVDMAEPYNVYGGLQDNGIWKGSSKATEKNADAWTMIGGGDGMYVQIDPRDPKTTYFGSQFGSYVRVDADASQHSITPHAKIKESPLRFNWCTPILLSAHSTSTLYFGTNRLYRSLDRGDTWQSISGELTRSKDRGDVPFATLTTISESPLRYGLLWVGSDDGRVHATKDMGLTWNDVSAGLPENRWCTRVEASHLDEDTAYVSFSGYRDDERTPYLFVTRDFGRTWKSIAAGLPGEPVNVVREDPVHPEILYVGTDAGAYVSRDSGASWLALSGGIPNVPVHDLVVHPRDLELVAGTHGRSVWVLDVKWIHKVRADVTQRPVVAFEAGEMPVNPGWSRRQMRWFQGPDSAPKKDLYVWVAQAGPVEFSLLDAQGSTLRRDSFEATAGINAYEFDLQLDPELALDVERRNAEQSKRGADNPAPDADAGKEPAAKEPTAKGDSSKTSLEADQASKRPPATNAEEPKKPATPWADAHALGLPIYLTAGAYRIRFETAGGLHEVDIKMTGGEDRPRRRRRATGEGPEEEER